MTGASERVTYRSVLANREFAAVLISQTLSIMGDQLARLAIALLVYERTDSGFAASATFAVSYVTYLFGGPVLSSLSDRYPRLSVMVVADLLRAPVVLLLAVDEPPMWTVFACLVLVGLLSPPFDSARSGLQPDILPGDAYVTGNALMNLVIQLGHVLGFVVGGAVVSVVSVRGALALDSASFVISAGVLLAAVRARPAAQAAEARGNLVHDTLDGFRVVRASHAMRMFLGVGLLCAVALIPPEGLAVPIAESHGGGSLAAGVLTAVSPAGYVLGTLVLLRLDQDRRIKLIHRLALLAMLPLLATPLAGSLPVVAALWFVSGVFGSLQIIASSAYVQAAPAEFRSRAFGVAITTLNAAQGLGLIVSGLLADATSPELAVALIAGAACALLVTVPRNDRFEVAQGISGSRR